MRNTGSAKRGFSLTEFLVVMGVIGTLASVALPAIQQARRDARSVSCLNNLKQIGLAMHNYHDTHLKFPPGWVNHHPQAGVETRFGWLALLLPYVEEYNLFDQFDFKSPIPPANKLFQTKIAIYRCPSDRTPDVNPLRGEYGTANYSGNFGPVAPPRWLPGRLSPSWPGQADTLTATNGLMWLNSSCGIFECKDGTSFTLMAGERSSSSGAGIWPGVGGNQFETDQLTDCSAGNEINSGFASFSSSHGEGANFIFADGRAQFISDKIDSRGGEGDQMGTYQRLSHRNDGQKVEGY